MNIIEFTGDPMLQLEKFEDIDNYIFYLNQEALEEIKSYSKQVSENIPNFFNDIKSDFIFLAEGGIDEEGKEFPNTYIGIKNSLNTEYPYYISGIYASDFQYLSSINGNEIYLKKNSKKK